jgi:hypothetical protein
VYAQHSWWLDRKFAFLWIARRHATKGRRCVLVQPDSVSTSPTPVSFLFGSRG